MSLSELFAPLDIVKLRWQLWVKANWDSCFRIGIERHPSVKFNQAESLKPFWQFVNYIEAHDGRKTRLVIGPVGMPLDDVMDVAEDQAFSFLNGEPDRPRAQISPILEPHSYMPPGTPDAQQDGGRWRCSVSGCNRVAEDPIHTNLSALPSEAHV